MSREEQQRELQRRYEADQRHWKSEFADLGSRFRVRAPLKKGDARGLRVVGLDGKCLAPLLEHDKKNVLWVDPQRRPECGDLVLIEETDEWQERLAKFTALQSPEYQARWREQNLVDGKQPRFVVKIFRVRNGVEYLLWNEGAVQAAMVGRVVGVVRHVLVDGRAAFGSYDPSRRRLAHFAVAAACAALAAIDIIWRFA